MNKLSVAAFTNVGYQVHARGFERFDADMTGSTALITGATGGLGFEIGRSLAEFGARVLIVGRDASKLEAAVQGIKGEVEGLLADLSLLSEVRAVAERVLHGEGRLDLLINNVGVLLPQRTETHEGIESTLATNVAGHFALTNLLAPLLVESSPSRVVNVTSGGMYAERVRPDDLQFVEGEYRGAVAYARTKRAQVILTEMWADRLKPHDVTVHSMHPGWAKTEGVASSLPTFNKIMKPLLRTPRQGADTAIWLAASDAAAESTGDLWFDRRIAPTHLSEATKETQEDRLRLWANLVELTGTDLLEPGAG